MNDKQNEINKLQMIVESMCDQDNYLGQINACKKILELDETNWYALVNISDCYLKLKQDKLAEPYVRKAYQLYKDQDDTTTINLSCIFIRNKDYESAISILEGKKNSDSDDYLVYNNLGYAYYLDGQYVKALDNYTISIQLEEHNSLAYCNRGILKHKIFNDEDGIEDLRKAELYGDYEAAILLYEIDKVRLS